jgi:hypothetical protein
MLSRSINAYPAPSAPLAGTSQLRRPAVYMRCLRCAGAPRRPASGSELSLPFFPSMSPSMSPGRLSLHIPSSFAISTDLRREIPTARPLPMSTISGHTDSLSLQPAELLASLSEAFTSGLSTVRSPSPPPDMTTVSTGQSPPTGLSPARMAAKRCCTTSQVPGGPTVNVPRSSTPAESLRSATTARRCCLPPLQRRRPPQSVQFRGSITRPAHSLSTLRRVSCLTATQDSLPDGWPAFPGGSWLPAGSQRKVSGYSILLSQASPGAL